MSEENITKYKPSPEEDLYDEIIEIMAEDDLDSFKELMANHNLNVNSRIEGCYLLSCAVGYRSPKIVRFLVENGAIIDRTGDNKDNYFCHDNLLLGIIDHEGDNEFDDTIKTIEILKILFDNGATY